QLRGLSGVVCNRDRAAQVLERHLTDDHLAEHLESKCGHLPCALDGPRDGFDRTVSHFRDQTLGRGFVDFGRNADASQRLASFLLRFRRDNDWLHRTIAQNRELKGTSGCSRYQRNEFFPARDRVAIDLLNLVAFLESVASGRTSSNQATDNRLQRRLKARQADGLHQVDIDFVRTDRGQVQAPELNVPAFTVHLEFNGLLAQGVLKQRPSDFLPGRHLDTIHARDQFTGRQPGLRRRCAGHRLADHGTDARYAVHEKHPIEQDCKQEVGNRTREHDGKAFRHGLAVECAMTLFRRNRTFALIQHLDVTTQRESRYRPLRLIRAELAAPQRHAESERKTQHFYIAKPRNDIVAQFVKHDQQAERDDKCNHGRKYGHDYRATPTASSSCSAARRACASEASTSSRLRTRLDVTRASTSSTTPAMRANDRRPDKKPATATSLAAFNTMGALPPVSSAR